MVTRAKKRRTKSDIQFVLLTSTCRVRQNLHVAILFSAVSYGTSINDSTKARIVGEISLDRYSNSIVTTNVKHKELNMTRRRSLRLKGLSLCANISPQKGWALHMYPQ